MSFQIIDRILFYASWPVTVNVAINFNKTIQFPSVAICNQNAFKITEAHRQGYLNLIEAVYSNKSREEKLARIEELNATDAAYEDLFLNTRHMPGDMIVKCEWDSKECHSTNFVKILTDHGVCYAFASNTTDPLYITDTGTDHGLRLTINVEQYEYMHGPHDSAGLKILLYDPAEEPLVYELGQAVATGTHTYVGVKVIQMKYLTAPYGNCTNDKKLKYYPYSETACKLECMHEFYVQKCNCTLLYMARGANAPVCTIGQYHDCILKAKDKIHKSNIEAAFEGGDILHPDEANERNKDDFNAQTVEPCDCPQPCSVPLYEPNFSYSTTSNFDVDKLLNLLDHGKLLERYIKARDVAHSVESKYFNYDKGVIEDCIRGFDDIRTLIHYQFPASIEDHLNALESIEKALQKDRSQRSWVLKKQTFVVKKNYIRGVEGFDERTWSAVSRDFLKVAYHFEHQLKVMTTTDNRDIRRMYRELLDVNIGAGRELVQTALKNFNIALSGYTNGVNILNYHLSGAGRNETIAANPTKLLSRVVFVPKRGANYNKYYFNRFRDDLGNLTHLYDQMHYMLLQTADTQTIDQDKLDKLIASFKDRSKRFLGARSYALDEAFSKPLTTMEFRVAEWTKVEEELDEILLEMKVNLRNLLERCKDIRESAWVNSSNAIDHARDYIIDQSHGKTKLGHIIADSSLQEAVTKIDNFFREIRTRSQGLHDNYDKFIQAVLNVWRNILEDDDAWNYYEFKNYSWIYTTVEDMEKEINDRYKRIRKKHDLIDMIRSRDHTFIDSMERMITLFKEYIAGNKLDAEFYRQNFLQMDVFYRKLSYELIEQQQAYDVFGLLCDIGGSMGLFIGASALTIFELLDVFAYVIFRKAEPKPIRSKQRCR